MSSAIWESDESETGSNDTHAIKEKKLRDEQKKNYYTEIL